jgi:alpha-maltose-1-phosphate synthase
VTADIHPLNQVVRDGQEGALFREGDVAGLAHAITCLLDDRAKARIMGAWARARVVEHYSWAQHCAELERIMLELVERKA